MTDKELAERAIEASGLSVSAFAREVLHGLRSEGAVRAWLRGGRMTASVRETLEGYLEQFRDAGQ